MPRVLVLKQNLELLLFIDSFFRMTSILQATAVETGHGKGRGGGVGGVTSRSRKLVRAALGLGLC